MCNRDCICASLTTHYILCAHYGSHYGSHTVDYTVHYGYTMATTGYYELLLDCTNLYIIYTTNTEPEAVTPWPAYLVPKTEFVPGELSTLGLLNPLGLGPLLPIFVG